MKRRTKEQMEIMRRLVGEYLLNNNNDYKKAFKDFEKDEKEEYMPTAYLVKGIQDFKKVSMEIKKNKIKEVSKDDSVNTLGLEYTSFFDTLNKSSLMEMQKKYSILKNILGLQKQKLYCRAVISKIIGGAIYSDEIEVVKQIFDRYEMDKKNGALNITKNAIYFETKHIRHFMDKSQTTIIVSEYKDNISLVATKNKMARKLYEIFKKENRLGGFEGIGGFEDADGRKRFIKQASSGIQDMVASVGIESYRVDGSEIIVIEPVEKKSNKKVA